MGKTVIDASLHHFQNHMTKTLPILQVFYEK